MSRLSCIITSLLMPLLVTGNAAAQWNVARFDTHPNRLYTSFGVDPAIVNSAGYARVFRLWDHGFQVSGDAGLATEHLDTRDFRLRGGIQTSIVNWRSLHFTGSATAITRGTDNLIYRGIDFGADLTGSIGVYRPAWFLAGEFGKDKAVITHVTHSDWYRENWYPDAKDGWYLDAGGTYHHGLAAGIALGRFELAGRFGWLRSEDYNDLNPPIYASFGIGIGF